MLSLMLLLAVMGNHARGDEVGSTMEKRTPGLIGLAHKNGDPTQIAYHYPHGKVFPADLIRSRFHDGETEWPPVEIALVGYVEVPHEMAVDVYHAAGGVNGDHGTLWVDGRERGAWDGIGDYQFSPDGESLSFGARRGNELLWVTIAMDGKTSPGAPAD